MKSVQLGTKWAPNLRARDFDACGGRGVACNGWCPLIPKQAQGLAALGGYLRECRQDAGFRPSDPLSFGGV